jgi:hypothetical protein
LTNVDASSATVKCQDWTGNTGVFGSWPTGAIPEPVVGTTYSVTKTSTLSSSQFGFLGGQWKAVTDKTPGTCAMQQVRANDVTISCQTDAPHLRGAVTLVVGSDCLVSGTTSEGIELSASRR